MEKLSQRDIVLEHLIKYGNISTIECYDKYRITDLAHAIMLLRKDNFPIKDYWAKPKNKIGYAKKFKIYYLEVNK